VLTALLATLTRLLTGFVLAAALLLLTRLLPAATLLLARTGIVLLLLAGFLLVRVIHDFSFRVRPPGRQRRKARKVAPQNVRLRRLE
jgi:hypothetical protein